MCALRDSTVYLMFSTKYICRLFGVIIEVIALKITLFVPSQMHRLVRHQPPHRDYPITVNPANKHTTNKDIYDGCMSFRFRPVS